MLQAHCVNCLIHIPIDVQHYFIGDMGIEIISIIEQHLSSELSDDGMICEQCILHVTQQIREESAFVPLPHDSNVCVWCRSSIYRRRQHTLPVGPERDLIAERIYPRQIPQDGLVCYACWINARQMTQQHGERAVDGHINTNICVRCSRSLNQRRGHSLPEGPERNEIAAQIHPSQIPEMGRVCYACWVNARRIVERRTRQNVSTLNRHIDDRCAWCQFSLHRRPTHVLLQSAEREVIIANIHPRQLPDNPIVCTGCWTRGQAIVNNYEPEEAREPALENLTPQLISLDRYRITTRSSTQCFIPGCPNMERHRVPKYLKRTILKEERIFVTPESRVCGDHLRSFNFDMLNQDDFSNVFNKNDLQQMLDIAIKEENQIIDFENINEMDDTLIKYWTGVTKLQFLFILNNTRMLFDLCRIPKTALGAYLMKNRTGDSHRRIASLLQMSTSKVCRLLENAREALLTQFVPLHLGVNHISRQNVITKNLLIPEGLFGDRVNRKPIVVVDGTYVYLQKSSNYRFQKESYSLHKYLNLVKPFLIVTTTGHILDIFGPYPATTSDAEIMKALFQDEHGEMRQFFERGDVFILDRGFRNAIPFLQSLEYDIYKPESVSAGETQLTTEKANISRCVTLVRWVVEVVNGRFKRDYKIFRQDFFNLAATHLIDDFRICGAFINAFHQEIVDRPDAELILNRAVSQFHLVNNLGDYVISHNINRRRAQFTPIDENHHNLNIFPQMDHSDLILFALGTYQIKQARSYYGEHIRQNGTFEVEVCNELENNYLGSSEIVLLRGRIRSRHHGQKIYYTYLAISPQGVNWEEKIRGYYCSCVCGMRTVGCCAHVMTIVWYLGWARHQDSITPPAAFLDGILIREEYEEEL